MARNPIRLVLKASLGTTLVAACSGAPTAPSEPHVEPPTAVPVASVAAPPSSASASSVVGIDPVPAVKPAEGPSACPEGMILIDGDYCTDLEVKCLKSHFAKANKKTVCEQFAEPSKCIGKKIPKRYCIDEFEYPNKKGENPEVMNDFPHAQALCSAQGKAVCTESQWTMACEGPSYKPYPYGFKRDPEICRGDRPYRFPSKEPDGLLTTHSKNHTKAEAELKRLWDALPSGSQPGCVSDYGVFDMPGNADELAASEGRTDEYGTMKMPDGHVETLRAADKFDNVTTGGPWVEGVRNQCRPKIYTHNEGFSYYYLSFRCCAEADGKPTDPRAPRQIKRGEKAKH